ncbi:hypothetical protein D0T49_07350 [Paludibacter sp. 221]|uniref:DUF6291 domain-containing protein n=1 Tax=Paludibacter sp. 221 TaxID=2302939 RepID=UPI0013D80692|nr:DUF6291 domain-containing protein [Paludibacter sp. 221]NDV46862.1 hypothetical protein [Paludibacter sp. 221]
MNTNKKNITENIEQEADILNIERDSFVFYRSYYEAIKTLKGKKKLIAYEAIAQYALCRKSPEDLPPAVLSILRMAIPNIDANHKKYFYRQRVKNNQNKKDSSELFEGEGMEQIKLPKKENKVNFQNSISDNELEKNIDSLIDNIDSDVLQD